MLDLLSMWETSEQHRRAVGMVRPGWGGGTGSSVAPLQPPVSGAAWLGRGTLHSQKMMR